MPEGHQSSLSGAFRKPFTEQIAYFRRKLGNRVPTRRWDDLKTIEHDRAFMVAGAMKADLLTDLAAAVDRAIAEGKSLGAFRKDFRAIVEMNGWHGWTGEDSAAGRAWRTRTIYRTNAATSYAAGRHAQLTEGNFPLWVYRHGNAKEPRIIHLSWDGLVLPPDHAFWAQHYPPSGWGCTCYVVGARSERGAKRLGGDPAKTLPAGWDRIDPKTGAQIGIAKGWDYAPGASASPTVRAMAEKLRHWDYRIAKGFMEGVPEADRDALAKSYRALPSVADDARRYARRVVEPNGAHVQPVWTLGLATSDQVATVARLKGADVALFDFSLSPSDIRHVQRAHGDGAVEAKRGQRAITSDEYALLPQIVDEPDAIEDAGKSDMGEPLILFRKTIAGMRYFAVFAVRKGRRTLGLKTFYAQ